MQKYVFLIRNTTTTTSAITTDSLLMYGIENLESHNRYCEYVWGNEVGTPILYGNSWRRMFIERPRLRTDGIFINKSKRYRKADNSVVLDDKTDTVPYTIVVHYRYIRLVVYILGLGLGLG